MQNHFSKIVITAVLAAIIYVATVLLPIPIPATGGYVNIGDAIILLAAWTIGGIYAGTAAAIGAGLADLFVAPIYAPGTIVIKFLVAAVAYLLVSKTKQLSISKSFRYIASGIVAEAIMVLGYLIYEGMILRLGYAAVLGIGGNLLQACVSIALGTVLIVALDKTKVTQKIFKTI